MKGKTNMRTLESYTLPQAWACAIVNGDYEGMSDDDKKACNTFLALNGLSGGKKFQVETCPS